MTRSPYLFSDAVFIIFAREPIQGQVKTRLIPALGEINATELYKRLLNYTISLHAQANYIIPQESTRIRLAPVELWITPESSVEYFQSMSLSGYFKVFTQQGNGLGCRMYNALNSALKNYSKAILIGTDCPFLSTDDLYQAVQCLNSSDMVFTPAKDGGYVLVGAKRLKEGVFEHIRWGSEQVMSQTRKQLMQWGIDWHELPQQLDIDDENDLKSLLQHGELKDYIMSIYDFYSNRSC